MGIGERIKEYRIKCNMTQKDLADQMHVTSQAVSRWENDEAEPSFAALRAMAAVFGCTINDLFDMKSAEPAPVVQEVKVVERVVQEPTKPVLAVCENCNKPIYESADIHRFEKRISTGRTSETRNYLYCTECNDARLEQDKRAEESERRADVELLKSRRIKSFVWPGLILAVCLAIAIWMFSSGETEAGKGWLIIGIPGFFFTACLFLKNNIIGDLWVTIARWGFFRLPGMIWQLSIGGLIIGMIIKVVLWLLSMILGIITTILATIIALIVSIFVYPYALYKNIKQAAGTMPIDPETKA